MSRIFITGSADGLGLMAARLLIEDGHSVTLHGRTAARVDEALRLAPGAVDALAGDLAEIASTRALADRANADGPFDAVIHNAGVGSREGRRIVTADGLSHVFQINVLAPYLLTALMERPKRLVYLSSGLHRSGSPAVDDLQWENRPWNGLQAYSDSKLFDVLLAFGVARRWTDVRSNAVAPGWVATKMGGPGASDDLDQGPRTQVWLAANTSRAADVTGGYFYHLAPAETHEAAHAPTASNALFTACERISGTAFPAA